MLQWNHLNMDIFFCGEFLITNPISLCLFQWGWILFVVLKESFLFFLSVQIYEPRVVCGVLLFFLYYYPWLHAWHFCVCVFSLFLSVFYLFSSKNQSFISLLFSVVFLSLALLISAYTFTISFLPSACYGFVLLFYS